VRRRGSSPKLLVHNTALMSAVLRVPFREARADADLWGRLTETAAGAHLLAGDADLLYWRERNREVDFVVRRGRELAAIEVTSGRRKQALPGLGEFTSRYAGARPLLVGGQGVPLEEFLAEPADRWFR
jgi:predicted AAA+ superfamily ATPase